MTTNELKILQKAAPKIYALLAARKLDDLTPPTILRMAMDEIFLDNNQGPEVEAFRRTMRAFHLDGVCRGTIEYEALLRT